jgi:hypothetical protein
MGAAPTSAQPRIGVAELLGDATARAGAAALPLLALLAVLGGVEVGLWYASSSLDARLQLGAPTPGYIVVVAIRAVAAGLGGAVALRLCLGGPRALRLDRGLLECAVLLAGAYLASAALTVAFAPKAPALAGQATTALVTALVLNISRLALGLLQVRLMFWPVGRLDGHHEVTPARSWTLTRRVTLSFVAADLIFNMPYGFLLAAAATVPMMLDANLIGKPDATWPLRLGLTATLGVAVTLAGYALLAAAYARRVDARARLAEVFA